RCSPRASATAARPRAWPRRWPSCPSCSRWPRRRPCSRGGAAGTRPPPEPSRRRNAPADVGTRPGRGDAPGCRGGVPAGGRLALVHPQVDAVPQLSAATRRRDLGLLLSGAAVSTIGSSLALLAVMVHLEPAGPGWIAAAWGAELLPVVLLAPVV